MRVKKLIALLLVTIIGVGAFAGCQSTGGSNQTAEPAASASQESEKAAETPSDSTLAPVQLKFATSSTGTVDYTTGSLLCTLFESHLPKGSTVTQETIASGNGTTGYLIEAGSCDIARGNNAVSATVGVDGRPPYKDVRAICALYTPNLICQIFTKKFIDKTGYTSLRECIDNKCPVRIVCEEVGSSDYVVLSYILEALGTSVEEIESWGGSVTYTGGSTEVEMLQDNQADLMIPHTAFTSSTVSELALSTDIQITSFDDEILNYFLERGFTERVVPAGTFGFFEQEGKSVGMDSSIIVSKNMSDEVAYELTKIIAEYAEKELGADNVTFTNLTLDVLSDEAKTVVPLHPGSVKYFKEKGAL